MPVYEYQCNGCGHEFEREQRITDKPVRKCPSCGALKAKRLISRTSFVLKGSGWYSDLYGTPKGGGKPAEGASGDAAKSSEAGSDAGAESKSEGGSKKDKAASKPKKKTPRAAA